MLLEKSVAQKGSVISYQKSGVKIAEIFLTTSPMAWRLFHSASLFRATSDREHADRVADGNAFLHWRDMLQARELGCEVYELGRLARRHRCGEPPHQRVQRRLRRNGRAAIFHRRWSDDQ